jgi:hypothetical protein
MSGGPDDPGKATQKPAQTHAPRHDPTGGPMTGRMVDHENYAWKQIKANQTERKADTQRHDHAKPNSEPARAQQQQPERKTLRTFEDRHPDTQTRGDMKREQSGAGDPQREAVNGRQPESQNSQGSRKPDHYKELKTFEQRHPGMDGRSR